MTQEQSQAEHDNQPSSSENRRALRLMLLIFGPLVLMISGAYMYMISGRYISTENAYIKADKIAISTDVDGRVISVGVNENQLIEAGQILFHLDPRPFQIALDRAEAELGIVNNEIESYRTTYRQELAAQKMAKDALDFADREFKRQKKLSKSGIVSKARYDQSLHQLQQAQQRMVAIQEDITHALVNLGGKPDLASADHPRYQQALAVRDQALLDLERTTIRAPAPGVVSNLSLQVGEFVEQGEPIFSLVASDKLWVTANLKETELTHVQVGQEVLIRADTYPDYEWRARVASISPATGAEFSLLPPQNATGNWVKVVQRIPVRLQLQTPKQGPPLRVGMSVEAEIDTRHQRPLPGLVRSALAWIKNTPQPANVSSGLTE